MEDAKRAIELGVDYLGFIIDYPKSPRSLSLSEFKKLARAIKKESDLIKLVGVVVDMDAKKLNSLISDGLMDVIQFHGKESPEFCKEFKSKIEVWKNIKITDSRKQIADYNDSVDRFLMDATSIQDKLDGKYNRFENFEDFKELKEQGYPLILAGGLNPDNIKYYIDKLNPEIVDVASGIEIRPGKKDFEKMTEFIDNINK